MAVLHTTVDRIRATLTPPTYSYIRLFGTSCFGFLWDLCARRRRFRAAIQNLWLTSARAHSSIIEGGSPHGLTTLGPSSMANERKSMKALDNASNLF
jgi:hypothetical protein